MNPFLPANPAKVASLITSPAAIALRQRLHDELPALVDEAVRIQQIPAPTFAEGKRADYVRQQFTQIGGLVDIHVDALNNVYARLPGRNPNAPALLIAAHTDTVFPAETDLTVQRLPDRIVGAGIGDNSLGVAALIGAARLLCRTPPEQDLWFAANTREEGLGDLGGIRAVIDRLPSRVGACLILEGMAYGQIYHAGIAVRRLKISAQTPGGHSWLHFGQPSAIHALVRVAAQISSIQAPSAPRTTYNIGLIEGGQSVNSIATSASLTLDLRSESATVLASLEKTVLSYVESARVPNIDFRIEVVGDRPAGSIPADHPLVQNARLVLETIGTTPLFRTGSTDANLPLARGVPAVTIGITNGSNAHRLDEYIELGAIESGMWQLVLLILSLSQIP